MLYHQIETKDEINYRVSEEQIINGWLVTLFSISNPQNT